GFYLKAQTGFFLVIEAKDFCEHPILSFDEKRKYCITDEAIIGKSEFKVDSELQFDLTQKNQFFNLRFTKQGFETLKMICQHMPEKTLVFIVNGKAAGTYNSKGLKPTLIMPINGIANSDEIKWVFENLKKVN